MADSRRSKSLISSQIRSSKVTVFFARWTAELILEFSVCQLVPEEEFQTKILLKYIVRWILDETTDVLNFWSRKQ